jgi:hypothetical protein
VSYLSMDDRVPSIDGLAVAVRGGEIARAAFNPTPDATTRGNGDDDRP